MTKLKALVNSIFFLGLTSLGVFIAFTVNWTNGQARYFGILAFLLVSFSSLFSSIAMTRLLIPCRHYYSFSSLLNPILYKELKTKIGKKIHLINVTYILLFFMLFTISAYSYVNLVDNHEYTQLKNYGQTQKVLITKIDYIGKGSPFAFFDFYYNDKKYSDRLSQKNLSSGDSSVIIFSTKNPEIIKWLEDFNPNKK